MNKFLVIAAGGVAIIGGIWWFSGRVGNAPKMAKEKGVAMEQAEEPEMEGDEAEQAAMMPKGAYVEYGPDVLEGSKSSKRILFFYANWCPFCGAANADFREHTDQIPSGVTIVRVNYNDSDTDQAEKDLAVRYGVTYQHSFVQIDGDGAAITKWNGGKISELVKNIK